jgi:hypothetical protein
LLCFVFVVQGIEPGALCMLDECSIFDTFWENGNVAVLLTKCIFFKTAVSCRQSKRKKTVLLNLANNKKIAIFQQKLIKIIIHSNLVPLVLSSFINFYPIYIYLRSNSHFYDLKHLRDRSYI